LTIFEDFYASVQLLNSVMFVSVINGIT